MRAFYAFPLVAACAVAASSCGDGATDPSLQAVTLASVLPGHAALRSKLRQILEEKNGGLGFEMWATILDRNGLVVDVVFSGVNRGDQWPGSRVISAQKANTANAFSLAGFALSTANLYAAVQPGGSLFGLQESNPVNPVVAYAGPASAYGSTSDPMIGRRIGGINVFGGGLALYDSSGELIGAVGVSGDTSCADHNIAWKLRDALVLDFVPAGVNPVSGDDNIVYDIQPDGSSPSGWGHPECSAAATAVAEGLPTNFPLN